MNFTDKQIDDMKEYLAHQDEYDCIILCNQLAGIIKDREKFHAKMAEIHASSKTPREKADKLRKEIANMKRSVDK